MAVDIFLKIKGIEGESKDASHKGDIDILGFSWSGSQSGTMHGGGGGGSGKVSVQDVSFSKYVDKASPNLIAYLCSGKHVTEATLIVRKAGGGRHRRRRDRRRLGHRGERGCVKPGNWRRRIRRSGSGGRRLRTA